MGWARRIIFFSYYYLGYGAVFHLNKTRFESHGSVYLSLMINITRCGLIMLIRYGEGLLLNKTCYTRLVYLLMLLTVWLLAYTHIINTNRFVTYLNVGTSGTVFLAVKTKSYFLFYIFFEASIMPITLLIFLFGYQPEKLQASLLLLLYTVFGRLPLLLYFLF